MLTMIKKIFRGNTTDYRALLEAGAVIVDVRTPEEFKSGHINGSVNIPLPSLQAKVKDLKKYPHVITVCRSGNRSGLAKSILKQKGIENVFNGGAWQNMKKYV